MANKPIPIERYAARNRNLKVPYRGYTLRSTDNGKVEVIDPEGGFIGEAPTAGAAMILVDNEFDPGPKAA